MADGEIHELARVCTRCGGAKPATTEFFQRAVGGKHGLASRCKVCRAKIRKEAKWPSEAPDVLARRAVEYRQANLDAARAAGLARYYAKREENAAVALAYYHNNKPRIRERQIERYRTDPNVRLRISMSTAIRRSLREGKAGRSWETIVGYTLDELKRHLERQFLKGMSWENMGKWHIDHILPLSGFCIEGEQSPGFLAAWTMTNLRPLWALDNIRKHAKRLTLL